MKKRLFWLLAALAVLLCLLTMSAGADGSGQVTAYNYDQLVQYLADSSIERLVIVGDKIRDYDPATNQYLYKEFAWPEGTSPLTLDLETAASSTDICIQGTWSIPSHVTVNAYQCVVLQYDSPRIVVEGTWNVADHDGYVMGWPGSSYGMVVNGVLTSSVEPSIVMMPASECPLTINGTMKVPGYCSIQNLTLGDGAMVVGTMENSSVMLCVANNGSISCPVGTATIQGGVREDYMSGATAFTLNGNLAIDELMLVGNVKATVSAGSNITVKVMNQYDMGTKLMINGVLVLDDDGYRIHRFANGSITVDSAGELVLMPGNELDYESSEATVTGSGTIRLYAQYDEVGDFYAGHPDRARVFERYGQSDNDWPAQVADTITIWVNWPEKIPSLITPGDINGDDAITTKDVTTLRRYIAGGYSVEYVEAALDVNGDGVVTTKDVTTLRRYIAGGYGVELG